ncbi:chemotaxis protein CheD [Fictibacillus phosphorivorans]|uniref:chemotaxis protein CheD n=1 Tax=Fictibacillus phosphorivorans TaxID=1221500 RepID=UPI00203AAF05|nr:chemotaxis protein CheD [Fictibacillus phosphorivorans]MCM3717135.1 chemotaxis protein CheD [Fictibacillus phosphorivorans]MCM3774822.1 chemotaxis protein CheD [Fictibacillus phosphorivorans]
MSEMIKVGIADINLVTPPNTIRTTGLGSCVGVILYDEVRKIAGMAHVMLPQSTLVKSASTNSGKFADTAIKALYDLLLKKGATAKRLKAKIAGGAQMFQFSSASEMMRIGPRNIESVKYHLNQLGIPLIASDVGGNSGRTIEFNPATYHLTIKTVNKGTKII